MAEAVPSPAVARLAGALYLGTIGFGLFAEVGSRGALINFYEPLGQSFKAIDSTLTSFGFQFQTFNDSAPNTPITFSLLSGAGLGGQRARGVQKRHAGEGSGITPFVVAERADWSAERDHGVGTGPFGCGPDGGQPRAARALGTTLPAAAALSSSGRTATRPVRASWTAAASESGRANR